MELRSKQYASTLASLINDKAREISKMMGRSLKIMNFCGTHEWTITHYGIRSLLTRDIELIPGPGCPVCITPGYYVDVLVNLSFNGYTILTYGDAFKLPGSRGLRPRSLFHAASIGGDVKVVYSFNDAIRIAQGSPSKKFIFFAVGFETTMPSTAIPLFYDRVPNNLLLLIAYRYTPPIVKHMLANHREIQIDGIIAPGHVSAVIGSDSWIFVPRDFRIPIVVSGFEPVDVLTSIYLILKMIEKNQPELVNEYSRVVKPSGNENVKKIMNHVFSAVKSYWRGIGEIPESGAKLSDEYAEFDVFNHLGIEEKIAEDKLPGCLCDRVVLGASKPSDCPLFLKGCTPQSPYGPCMVSNEGACRIWAESV